jgi:cellulose synthase/poly-beta-1,6-N-acetylglucosamine synthase-like glycosyltransferase
MNSLDVLFVVLGGMLAAAALYLLIPAVVALFYRERMRTADGNTHVVVLVPAHDEEGTIGHCVHSFENQTYPRDRYRVVVVADNCTDDTARVASRAGAEVLVRNEPDARGKGRALRWALEKLLARDEPPDAVVVVDADSTPDPDLLTVLVTRFEDGAEAVQGESLIVGDGSPEQELRAAAFLLVNRARPTGRAMLGLPPDLAGNGMLFGRELLAEHPWSAFSSTEDLEYGLELRAAGIEPVFARGAIVWSPAAPHGRAAETQQMRWEGGKLHLARTHVPKLLAGGHLDAAIELAIPPLGYLAASAGALTVSAIVLFWLDGLDSWAVVPAAFALGAIPAYVFVGLAAAKAPRSAYAALAHAPVFVVRKALRAHRLLRFRPDSWVRTERR